MKKQIIYLLLFVTLSGGWWSCGDFFEESSQNQAYAASVKDLDELLVGEAYINREGFSYSDNRGEPLMLQTRFYFPWIHVLDDDITEFAEGYSVESNLWIRSNAAPAYRWQRDPFMNRLAEEYPADEWNNTYKRIAVLNSIIFQVGEMRADEPDKDLCNKVEGEARFLRASYYLWLVNLYAHPYATTTAQTEPGVPLKISEAIEDKYFSRASVQAVYDQIKTDLEQATECLKGLETPRPIKGNYAAAALLMSRACLYTEDYPRAIAYADSVIHDGRYRLSNLNNMQPGDNFTHEGSPETIFTQGGYIMGMIHTNDSLSRGTYAIASGYTSSEDLLKSYDEKDLRLNIFFEAPRFTKGVQRCLKFRGEKTDGRISDYMLIRLAEAYLNKAEAQAIGGDQSGAKNTLNLLREKRFANGRMPSIEERMAETGENLVNFIRSERRRELCCEGHRWFDLRRYAVNSQFPFSKTIRHPVREWEGNEQGHYIDKGYYELRPYAEDRAAYVFPLPSDEILFNKGELKQNEIRPERNIIAY